MKNSNTPILQLSDDRVSVTIHEDFSGVFVDRERDVTWRMSPCCYEEPQLLSECAIWNRGDRCYMDHYPAYFKAKKTDNGLRVTIMDQLGEAQGELTCGVTLKDGVIRFHINEIDEGLPSLIFPPYIESESLVVPKILGQWHQEPVMPSAFIMPASGRATTARTVYAMHCYRS